MRAHSLVRQAEKASWIIGVALLLTYAGGRLSGEVERQRAMTAFAKNKAYANAADQNAVAPRNPPLSALIPILASDAAPAEVNQTDWSASRIRSYADSSASDSALPIALLRIPRIELEVPVYATLSERNLNRGASLVTTDGMHEEIGNIAIAAHRDGYFRALSRVKIGDWIEFESMASHVHYRIASVSIVDPDDVSPLQATDHAALTLITCYPFWFAGQAPKRYIVRALVANQDPN